MTTWNPSDKNSNFVLSNNNLTATYPNNISSWGSIRCNTSHSTGKYYFEFSPLTIDSNSGIMIGIANSSMSLSSYLGHDSNGCGFQSEGSVYISNGNPIGAGPSGYTTSAGPVGIAVDIGTQLIWFYSPQTGKWNNDVIGNQNPATGTGGVNISAISGALYIGMSGYGSSDSSDSGTLNTGATPYSYSIPSGFSSWDTQTSSSNDLWNSAFAAPNFSFSNNNLTTTIAGSNPSNWVGVRGVEGKSSGKLYFELEAVATDASFAFIGGIVSSTWTTSATSFPGFDTNGIGFQTGGSVYYNASQLINGNGSNGFLTGQSMGCAVNLITNKIWFYSPRTSDWNNDVIGNQNPATGTGGFSISTITANLPIYIGYGCNKGGNIDIATMNTTKASFSFSIPSGFTAWDALNANSPNVFIMT